MERKNRLVLFALAIFVAAAYGQSVAAQELDGSGWYKSHPDSAFVWHPEEIYVVWPDMELGFRLPYEHDRTGVANLLFRDRKSGRVSVLDSISAGHDITSPVLRRVTHIPEGRHFRRFEPGSYDAILLYNNGEYVTYDNITFEKGVKIIVDMTGQPILPADRDSYEWLSLRKFTDVIGERTILKNYTAASPDKILGYVFGPLGKSFSATFALIRVVPEKNYYDIVTKCAGSSNDGYFEFDVEDSDMESVLKIESISYVTRGINIKPNIGLFVVMEEKPMPEETLNMKTVDLAKVRMYKQEFAPDTAFLWHPEEIHTIWPDMSIEFRLPYEEDRSGVANLLFRNRSSDEICLLDAVEGNSRYYNTLGPGGYDAILLYNNGKYVTYENLTLAQGVKMIVDMTGLSILPADRNSRKWRNFRKFTYVVGERTLTRNYALTSTEKIVGYVFDSYKGQALSGAHVRRLQGDMYKKSYGSNDGYFEFDPGDNDMNSKLEIFKSGYESLNIKIKPNSGYFIVMEKTPGDVPKMIGTGAFEQ